MSLPAVFFSLFWCIAVFLGAFVPVYWWNSDCTAPQYYRKPLVWLDTLRLTKQAKQT